MSLPLTINGVVYPFPQEGDNNWGPDVTDWAVAVTGGMLQKSGGLFQLLAEVDFGTGFGVKSLYYKSRTANVADAGQVRLARADVISWRNQANNANLDLSVNASNQLLFNGTGFQGTVTVTDTATINLTFAADVLSADIVADSITNSMINSAAAIAYSKLALTGSIVNADINASAAIAYSKLALTGAIVNADVSASAAIAYSKLALTGAIVNADISASAAIAYSKLALTGAIVNADLANMAESTIKGRAASTGTGAPVDLSATQATAILNNLVGDSGAGGTKGLAPAPAAGDAAANKFLAADGTWKATPGGGDVVGPASSTLNGFAKFADTTGKLLADSPATVTNSDIAASAGIAVNKLAALTASRAVVSDGSGFISAATTTATEIGYVNGVTSAIQTQLDGKLPTTITTTGDLIYSSSGTTASPLAIGGTGTILTVNSGLPSWRYPTYRNATTTDAPTLADEVIECSGASFTVTLPTAVGCQGKIFTIKHGGTSLSQVYTLNTTSAQTIGGIASGSYILYTAGETLTIQSNNANWIILDHYAQLAMASYTPGTSGTFSTNATWTGKWGRDGAFMIGSTQCDFAGATDAATNANMRLPTNTPNIVTGDVLGGSKWVGSYVFFDNSTSLTYVGSCIIASTTVLTGLLIASANTATHNSVQATTTVPVTIAASDIIGFTWRVPILGFQP